MNTCKSWMSLFLEDGGIYAEFVLRLTRGPFRIMVLLFIGNSVPFDEIIHLLFTFIACTLVPNLRFNSRAISSHIFRTSLLTSSSWRSAHRLTTALCSSCGHLSHYFLYFTAEPSANLELVGLSYHTCRTTGPIKQNSAGLRLRSKIGPANVGWKWRIF